MRDFAFGVRVHIFEVDRRVGVLHSFTQVAFDLWRHREVFAYVDSATRSFPLRRRAGIVALRLTMG
jgi:hypothetical protein